MDIVERHITLPADLHTAWGLLTDPDDLAAWLGREVVLHPSPGAAGTVVDHDGTRRRLVIDDVDPGRRLAWRWWTEGGEPSRVTITLTPTDSGTAVRVVEELLRAPTRRGPAEACTRAAEAWSHRLLHLEALLLVAAAVRG